jgi:serine/threonine protein kinase
VDDYAGRVLADRYRLPLPPSDEYDLVETRAFDTYSGQEVLVSQVPLPEVVDAEFLDGDRGETGVGTGAGEPRRAVGRTTRRPTDPAVRRAIDAATAAAAIPDHPRLDQVFDVFAEEGSLWIVSELIAARPLAALLAERPLSPYRAAEVASEVLTALRALHTHGWTHRNITARTVLVCDDGRVMLTGLAAGAAEEALCGYDPAPPRPETAGSAWSEAPESSAADFGTAAPSASPGGLGTPADGYAAAGRQGVSGPGMDTGSVSDASVPGGEAYTGTGRGLGDAAPVGSGDGYAGSAGGQGAVGAEGRRGHGTAAPAPAGYAGAAGGPGAALAARLQQGAPDRDDTAGTTVARRPGNSAARAKDTGVGGSGTGPGEWDELVGEARRQQREPVSLLAAERARQARIAVVGAVTERWAPEQAGPVHENWQLAPPVGPATDLWALGALLFRAVQGHAPYPEESAVELVQLVCAEPPAFAEECGPLRPVVESLLRQDPTERPETEELRGWLRSLVRSAPEPDAGTRVVPMPSIGHGGPGDPRRLPVVRRRGEVVKKRRATSPVVTHGRHKAARGRQQRGPQSLGRMLLVLILLALAAAIAYAMLFMPEAGEGQEGNRKAQTGSGATAPSAAPTSATPQSPGDSEDGAERPEEQQTEPASTAPQTEGPEGLAEGFVVRKDPAGFQVAVDKDWNRTGLNGREQVRYSSGDFELVVVPGRDTVTEFGADPMVYQREREHELQPFRDSTWSTATGLRRIDVGQQAMAEGQFTWSDSSGREVYVRNLAMIVDGKYHIVMVIGPESERDEVTRIFEQASTTYRPTG